MGKACFFDHHHDPFPVEKKDNQYEENKSNPEHASQGGFLLCHISTVSAFFNGIYKSFSQNIDFEKTQSGYCGNFGWN
jgi:hypothetical protein